MGARRRRKRSFRRKARRPLTFLLFLALFAVAAWAVAQHAPPQPLPPAATGELRVHVLDVGQGDATLWELPGGGIVVYDCGPPAADAASNAVVQYLEHALGRAPGSRLHALVASHGHLDHIGGCEEVLAEYAFDHVFDVWYEGRDAPRSYARFQEQALAEDARLHKLADFVATPRILLPPEAEAAGVRAEVLWPRAMVDDWDRIAEASIVVRLTHGGASYCFQGDIERAQEQEIAQASGDECDFYLVGHHGSRHASDAGWLSVMDPDVAVVSFGDNSYGHPTSEALCRVQSAGATLYATHRSGDVVVESAGDTVRVVRGEAESVDYCAGASYW